MLGKWADKFYVVSLLSLEHFAFQLHLFEALLVLLDADLLLCSQASVTIKSTVARNGWTLSFQPGSDRIQVGIVFSWPARLCFSSLELRLSHVIARFV